MPRPYFERVDITSVLRNILDNYPAGVTVLRELLQNSDDAKAKSQIFVLDTNFYPNAGLKDPALAQCNGPALLAINDATFQEKDWVAITTIHDSSKSSGETTTGKYGLGFRSSYHVTDNPQIYSMTDMLILDAHQDFEEFPGGMKLNSSEGDVERFPELYLPFKHFTPNPKNHQGTIIRLPLRSPQQAEKSRIKSGSDAQATPAVIRGWFDHFITKELPIAMLYLKHITSIEFRVVTKGPNIQTIALAKIPQTNIGNIITNRSLDRGRSPEMSHYVLEIETHSGEQLTEVANNKWMVVQVVQDNGVVKRGLAGVLGRHVEKVEGQMRKDKLLPHVALALPLPSTSPNPGNFRGKLFSLLPLPIITEFPLHIHAIFALFSSRQHLRNIHERVERESRERLLIEWNKYIFNIILPQAWSYLMEKLSFVNTELNMYSVWPNIAPSNHGDSAYWFNLPSRLMQEASSRPIWPEEGGSKRFMLDQALVAGLEPDSLVKALQAAGLPIVRPPQHIFELISKSPLRTQILSPILASAALKVYKSKNHNLTVDQTDAIAEYIAQAGDISPFHHLPLVRNVRRALVLIRDDSTTATQEEATLFADMDPSLLALDLMPPITRALVSQRVQPLAHSTVRRYLRRFSTEPLPKEPPSDGIDWLCRFWEFMSSWRDGPYLLPEILEYYLIPTRGGTRRPVSARIHDLADFLEAAGLVAALELLAVPLLHEGIGSRAKIFLRDNDIIISPQNVRLLLDTIQFKPSDKPSFNTDLRQALNKHLRNQMALQKQSFNERQIATLLQLPVFPVFSAGVNPESTLDAPGQVFHFVNRTVTIIPELRGVAFIDASSAPEFVRALKRMDDVKNEVAVLEIVIENQEQWTQQSEEVSEQLVHRLFDRISDLTRESRRKLREFPLIDVGGGLRSLSKVVDPEYPIAELFNENDHVFPVGKFGIGGAILPKLRASAFLPKELSKAILSERILKHRTLEPPRALKILELLDQHYLFRKDVPEDFIPNTFFTTHWVPAAIGSLPLRSYAASSCRDRQPNVRLLYDLAMPTVEYEVKSPHLLQRLGWNTISTEVIIKQMKEAIKVDGATDEDKHQRLLALITEIGSRFQSQKCTLKDILGLQPFLARQPWIPISESELETPQFCFIESVDHLGSLSRFKRLPRELRTKPALAFLEKVGVHTTPTMDALLSELDHVTKAQPSADSSSDELVGTSVAILTEITNREGFAEKQRSSILVPITNPGSSSTLFCPVDEVFYEDMGGRDSAQFPSVSFAHQFIPSELATKLALPRRSDLEFELVEDHFESFELAEDINARIRQALDDYTIHAASNEWIASADDAGASKVSFLCNQRTHEISAAPSPALIRHFKGPSLIVHNSAIIREDELDFLKRADSGRGPAKPDPIQRFVLGVLLFYHFGDVVMLVSGMSVLLLDPSMDNLPRRGRHEGGGKRTGLKMSIQACREHYPDLLLALDGVEGFDASMNHYEGTIFQVPLRSRQYAPTSKISKIPVDVQSVMELFKVSYWANAEKSLFFTKIASIKAFRIAAGGEIGSIWSIDGKREELEAGGEMSHQRLSLVTSFTTKARDQRWAAEWLIASCETGLSPDYEPLAASDLVPRNISSALAVQLPPIPLTRTNHDLFATLPLPIKINLNAHVHSQWILSGDGRQINLDLGNQQSLSTPFNNWLLSDVVPRLLLHAIALLLTIPDTQDVTSSLWPHVITTPQDRLVAEGFYRMLPTSQEPLFQTPSGRIPPASAVFGTSNKRASVYVALSELCPDQFVVPPPGLSSVPRSLTSSLNWSTVDSPAYVHSILSTLAPKIIAENTLAGVDLDELVCYLLQGGQSLIGLPLLRLQNQKLLCFTRQEDSDSVVFAHNIGVAILFGTGNVVTRDGKGVLKPSTVEAIINTGALNLCALNVRRFRGLLSTCRFAIRPCSSWAPENSRDAHKWVDDFWRLCKETSGFGVGLKAEDVEDLPLLPTIHDNFISLLSCREQVAFWGEAYHRSATKPVLDVLVNLGCWVIGLRHSDFPWNLPKDYRIYTALDVELVLECLVRLGPVEELVRRIGPDAGRTLVAWIGTQSTSIPPSLKTMYRAILGLPLWEARQTDLMLRPSVLKPLAEVFLLPPNVKLSAVATFMFGQGAWFSEYSSALKSLLPYHHILSTEQFVDRLRLPNILEPGQSTPFSQLLRTLQTLDVHPRGTALVPAGDLRLSLPIHVYHPGVPLYAFAFQFQPGRLVAPDFRDMLSWFESLGLSADVTSDGFVAAVTAIDEFIRGRREPVTTRAAHLEVAFDILNERSSIFPFYTREPQFRRIQSLRFIQCRRERRSIPRLEHLANEMDPVLGLDCLVREEFNPIVWTQRARFAKELTSDLKATFPTVGVPRATEVVEHLVVLARAARGNEDLDNDLIEDIIATYHWLNEHSDEARAPLSTRTAEPLYWNVDQGDRDIRIWHSAKTLWLNISHDDKENDVYSVKTLIGQFPQLLKAAGVKEFPRAEYSGITKPRNTVLDAIHLNGNRFRTEGILTDVVLLLDGKVALEAHRIVLAESSAYFEGLFTEIHHGGRTPEQLVEVRVPGFTLEVVESALHYIYMAQFSSPHAPIGPDKEATDALTALVNLLDLSNRWGLDGLKLEVEKSIIDLDLVGPTTVDSLIERCRAAEAGNLRKHCERIRDFVSR